MSEINPPLYLEAGEHPSNLDRLFHADLVTAGIISAAHLEVTEQATPALGVTVAAGRALVAGDEASDQGLYYVSNDADKDVALATADATNARIDLVVARVKDSFYSGVDDEWALEAVTGTPAASPTAPSAPSNSLILAEVTVPADAGGNPPITDAEITDKRELARLLKVGETVEDVRLGIETSTTTTYASFSGDSPEVEVTVPASGVVKVTIGAQMVNTGAAFAWMSFRATGANTLSGDDNRAILMHGTNDFSVGRTFLMTGLTPGVTQFREVVRVSANLGSWRRRRILVETVP